LKKSLEKMKGLKQMVEICLPGTGGMLPLEYRWTASCWLECQGTAILIDCGEGTQIALKKANCSLRQLKIILLTHFHGDHVAGMPGFLMTLGNRGRTDPLIIAGPVGLKEVLSSLLIIAPVLPFAIFLKEVKEEGEVLDSPDVNISTIFLQHAITCLGYRIAFKRKPVFNPEKAKNLGVPLTDYKKLHAGESVILPDGSKVEPWMVLDGQRKPTTVCYITDTKPFAELADFARKADLLVCEGMHGDTAMREDMWAKGHMVFADSAAIAKKANVKELLLTHFSPSLKNPEQYLDTAANVFPNTIIGYDGIRLQVKPS